MHRFIRLAALATLASLGLLILTGAPAGSAQSRSTAPKKLSSWDPQVDALLAKMTLDEKIGQMTQADLSAIRNPEVVTQHLLGSVLSGGSSDPKEGNSLQAWTDMYDGMQAAALKTRLAIPILYGVDAVHGHNNVLGAVVFPHNIGLGCTRNPALVEKASRITAIEVRATGIQWAFAPCVTVPRDERWGRTYEGFSEDPELVAKLGEAATRGLQGASLDDPLSVLACAKHYLGDGGTSLGTGIPMGSRRLPFDQGDTRISEAELRKIHIPGYPVSIRAGVGTVMPSYSSWNGVKLSGHKYLLTDVLKKELGFEGFLISDYNAIDQVPGATFKDKVALSINAGMDMGMVPTKYVQFIKVLKEAVEDGTVPMARIDDAVRRILRVKFAMGLMDSKRNQLADRKLHEKFGSAEHRAVARQCVRESLVLLKNQKKTLPLKKSVARIHVAGKSADDLGNQCGGWTIDWQGKSGAITPGGTTVLAAIRKAVSGKTQVTTSADGSGAEGASVGVVVIGEKPYAEGNGDRTDLSVAPEDVAAVAAMKKAGIPVVVILLSGRPMILGPVLEQADALIAAWLPGTEGDGVADVLFGAFKPTGKLSFSWPKSNDQIPVNVGDAKYEPLFKYGYGLSY